MDDSSRNVPKIPGTRRLSESVPTAVNGWRQNSLTISTFAEQSAYWTEKAYNKERFARTWELGLLCLALVLASINGLFVPLGIIIYGEFVSLLIDRTVMNGTSTPTHTIAIFGGGEILTNASADKNKQALLKDSQAFAVGSIVFSILQFVVGAASVDIFNYIALRQIDRVKYSFLEAIIRQDITWYDLNTSMNFATKVSDDIEKFKDGIGEKVPIFVYLVMSFITAVIISFGYGWQLTSILLLSTPVVILTTTLVAKIQSSLTSQELKAYSVAGVIAEEVLSSIKTVIAFGGEEKEIERYGERLAPTKKTGTKKGIYSGLGSGVMWLMIYATDALGFWYGVKVILESRHEERPSYTPAGMMIIYFSIVHGAQNVGLTSPHLEAISSARASAGTIFDVINRKPAIDSLSDEGMCPEINGDIEITDAFFRYPARADVQVLNGLSLKINLNETVALVGQSGSGKSTVLQLIQRLYDPDSGTVKVSGHDLRNLNVRHYRGHIAVVGQEPVLFAGSIKDNIRMSNPSCSEDDIIQAAKGAYCHHLIKMLPEGYNTMLGERGAQLSGGQKQRIAIARALVRKPKILILDEATSALDSHSEAKVQKALDAASQGRTTIMVSHRYSDMNYEYLARNLKELERIIQLVNAVNQHRHWNAMCNRFTNEIPLAACCIFAITTSSLATVLNATRIVFMDKGEVVEMGTHDELINKKGRYYNLVLENDPSLATKTTDPSVTRKQIKIQKPHQSLSLSSSSSDSLATDATKEGLKENVQAEKKVTAWQILKLSAPEKWLMLLGVLGAIAVGASFPMFAILFGEIFGLLEHPNDDYVRKETSIYCSYFLLVGVWTGVGMFLQIYIFNLTGVRLTARLRVASFKAMLKQEIGWFDQPANGIGALCSKLAADASAVQGAAGTRIGALMQASATVFIGIAISLYFSWKMTLVSIIFLPLVIGAVVVEGKVMANGATEMRKSSEKATTVATEAINNIKTVAAMCGESGVMARYRMAGAQARITSRKSVRWRGSVYAWGQTAPIAGYALSLWYGGVLVANKDLSYKNAIKVSEALIFGAWMMGQALAFAPNFGAAMKAAGRIFELLERKPLVRSTDAPAVAEAYIADGKITYNNIKFRYPTRLEVQVLKGLSLSIPSGKRVALVGPSGCGKSTLIQLLQRLYDADEGGVYLDDYNVVTDMRLTTLRRNLGIVSQEPVLFDRTIAENIAYGDNTRQVAIEEIVQAATQANIHTFIAALPKGYKTRIGARASQLSGGQKQRIAIARALVRNPRVLLLDEATSALDTHSEKVVQEALDKASEGRTCLIIAHRLATIKNADMICVIDAGIITELGSHKELIAKKGIYAKLYELQCGNVEEAEENEEN